MTEKRKNAMLACAKGNWQREIVKDLIQYGTITNPIKFLRGAAKQYSKKYEDSLYNLIRRIESETGIKIRIVEYGSRGGMWSAKYGIVA